LQFSIFRIYFKEVKKGFEKMLLNALAVFSVFLIIKKFSFADKFINSVLTFLWLWMGIVYHIIFFSKINPAANIFGIIFILQGILFFYFGVIRGHLTYTFSNSYSSIAGFIFILFALFIYPSLELFLIIFIQTIQLLVYPVLQLFHSFLV